MRLGHSTAIGSLPNYFAVVNTPQTGPVKDNIERAAHHFAMYPNLVSKFCQALRFDLKVTYILGATAVLAHPELRNLVSSIIDIPLVPQMGRCEFGL